MLLVGDDWAEDHHDVYLMNDTGDKLTSRRLPEGLAGTSRLHELIAEHAQDPAQVVIGIETDRGLWVDAATAAGYQVFAINPLAAARYRDHHHVSGAKSDPSDAKLLADLVRTDRHNHRLIAGDSDAAEAIKVLARAHQNLIWAAPGTPTGCAARCGSTTRRRWRRSRIWATATRWPSWAAPPPPPTPHV